MSMPVDVSVLLDDLTRLVNESTDFSLLCHTVEHKPSGVHVHTFVSPNETATSKKATKLHRILRNIIARELGGWLTMEVVTR